MSNLMMLFFLAWSFFAFVHSSPVIKNVHKLKCKDVVKSGTLALRNTNTGERRLVTAAKNFTVEKYLASRPQLAPSAVWHDWKDASVLSSYAEVTSEQAAYEFRSCLDEHVSPLRNINGKTYFGRLSPTLPKHHHDGKPLLCARLRDLSIHTQLLTAEKCIYQDDATGLPFDFTWSPEKQGEVEFVGTAGREDGETPAMYNFSPGAEAAQPAMTVVDAGSANVSDWVLRLE